MYTLNEIQNASYDFANFNCEDTHLGFFARLIFEGSESATLTLQDVFKSLLAKGEHSQLLILFDERGFAQFGAIYKVNNNIIEVLSWYNNTSIHPIRIFRKIATQIASGSIVFSNFIDKKIIQRMNLIIDRLKSREYSPSIVPKFIVDHILSSDLNIAEIVGRSIRLIFMNENYLLKQSYFMVISALTIAALTKRIVFYSTENNFEAFLLWGNLSTASLRHGTNLFSLHPSEWNEGKNEALLCIVGVGSSMKALLEQYWCELLDTSTEVIYIFSPLGVMAKVDIDEVEFSQFIEDAFRSFDLS